MSMLAMNWEIVGLCRVTCSVKDSRKLFWLSCCLIASLSTLPTNAATVYSESFDGAAVPSNWTAQNGTAGMATLAIVDDTGGLNGGNALQMTSATRQGVIGSFPELAFANVGDKIELCFDARLTQFPNNAGGFRFGLYHDNGGQALSSGYRALVGTGNNYLSTDVQADGGDPDIAFGTNRENPPGFQSDLPGINTNDPHAFSLILTKTVEGVSIDVWQDGVSNFPAPVEHITGMGAGTPIPVQTKFNQIAFTTNGGYVALLDNVGVKYTPVPEPSSLAIAGVLCGPLALVRRRLRSKRQWPVKDRVRIAGDSWPSDIATPKLSAGGRQERRFIAKDQIPAFVRSEDQWRVSGAAAQCRSIGRAPERYDLDPYVGSERQQALLGITIGWCRVIF